MSDDPVTPDNPNVEPGPQLHPGSQAIDPGTPPAEFDTGLNYPVHGSPMDPTNPVPELTVPPDPDQPGGITAPIELPTVEDEEDEEADEGPEYESEATHPDDVIFDPTADVPPAPSAPVAPTAPEGSETVTEPAPAIPPSPESAPPNP